MCFYFITFSESLFCLDPQWPSYRETHPVTKANKIHILSNTSSSSPPPPHLLPTTSASSRTIALHTRVPRRAPPGAAFGPGVVRRFPLVPGIDCAGLVASSTSELWQRGDAVVLTGRVARRDGRLEAGRRPWAFLGVGEDGWIFWVERSMVGLGIGGWV